MAELAFEYLLAGLEDAGALGTPTDPPDSVLNMAGTVVPQKAVYRPDERRGTLAEYYRSQIVRRWCTFEAEGGADVYTLPLLLNALVFAPIDGSGAVPAEITIDLGVANTSLDYEAVTAGSVGNRISIEYVDPEANSSPLDVDVAGNAIIVFLATDGSGDITTEAGEIITAIGAHPVASGMVTVANTGGHDGLGTVTAWPQTYLEGGVGADIITPPDGILTRLWGFIPTMDADDLQALTLFWGDPNVQVFRATYCQIDTLTLAGDASGEDGVTMSITGMGQFPSLDAPAGVPAMLSAPLLMPGAMELWIDTPPTAIGTTPITGRVVSAEATIPSGVVRKYLAEGPGGDLEFTRTGRQRRHAEMRLVFELADTTQYNQWAAHDSLRVRLRFNGPLIENVGAPPGTDYYHYVEVDIYGPFDALSWGEMEATNRTIELNILSEYDADAGYDWAVRVQSDRDSF